MGAGNHVGYKQWLHAQAYNILIARKEHNIIGGEYIWCDWASNIGKLVLNSSRNFCDRCDRDLWNLNDSTPIESQLPWRRRHPTRKSLKLNPD